MDLNREQIAWSRIGAFFPAVLELSQDMRIFALRDKIKYLPAVMPEILAEVDVDESTQRELLQRAEPLASWLAGEPTRTVSDALGMDDANFWNEFYRWKDSVAETIGTVAVRTLLAYSPDSED